MFIVNGVSGALLHCIDFRVATEEAMEACKLQIQAINAMNSCPRCGAKIKPEMMFCSSCGMKLQSEEQETVEEEQERPAFCSECGAPLEPDMKFCTVCGHKVDE